MSVAEPAVGFTRAARAPGAASKVFGLAGTAGLAAMVLLATRAGQEATTLALLIALPLLAVVVARPQVGVLIIMANYLIASYPTPLAGAGLLTVNNVLGVLLAVLMIAQLAQRPDLGFLRLRQLHIYVAIGVVLVVGTIVSHYQFPDLRVTWGKKRMLDQTAPLAREFVTRLAYLVLAVKFLTSRRDLKHAIVVVMGILFLVVPSALLAYAGGAAEGGRAAAEFSIGTNANRLAFLCLMQAALWWYLAQTLSAAKRTLAYGVVATLVLTTFLTASRSGVLGFAVLLALLARGRPGARGGRLQVLLLAVIAAGMLATVVPEQTVERLQNLNPFATRRSHEIGAYSTERRVATVELGWRIFGDYPLFGVGLGNFREVARQVYVDPYYRSPHNSFLWSLSEGGIFCCLLFLLLFYVTWRDIRWVQRAPALPADLRWLALGLEPVLLLLLFYSAFADMWLSPVTYILVILVILLKRHVSTRRVVVV